MRFLFASLVVSMVLPGEAVAVPCGPDISMVSDVRRVEGALFPEQFLAQEEHIRWGMVGTDDSEEGSWLGFVWKSITKIKPDGVVDRYLEVQRVVEAVRNGKAPGTLGIPADHYRLRNVAEMQDVIVKAGSNAGGIAAHSLLDANAWFYTLFGNDSGSFENMDLTRYREIGALQADEAAVVLPEFEAETFRRSGDKATTEFGNSLSPDQRRELFLLHSEWFAPQANPHRD